MAAENSCLVVVSPAGYNQLFKMADRVSGGHRGKLYPGMKKEKFIRQHVIRKMMVGYGGMLAILAFMMIYGLLNQTPELAAIIFKDDAGGKSGRSGICRDRGCDRRKVADNYR